MSLVPELEITISGHKYRITRMSAFDQMTIASEFRDILVGLTMLRDRRPEEMTDKEYNQAVQFITMSRGGVTEETRHRIMDICFSQITRRSGQAYARILAGSKNLQFDDIGLPEIARLMHVSFEHNKLLDFFGEGPSDSGRETATEEDGQPLETGKTG